MIIRNMFEEPYEELDFDLAKEVEIDAFHWRYTMPFGTVYSVSILMGSKFPYRTIYRLKADGSIAERVE